MYNIAVLISGGGTNLQALIDAEVSGSMRNGRIALVVSDRKGAYGLERAKENGIKNAVIPKNRPEKLLSALAGENIDILALCGYLSILPIEVVEAYPCIINIHPSLIPAFCGKGFYGDFVHQAVLKSGASETGATVHFVDAGVDTGDIIIQKRVPVLPGDTVETLKERVLETEHELITETLIKITDGGLCRERADSRKRRQGTRSGLQN